MNGPHDMGGMHGFGPVLPEENEPVFHAEWEKTVYVMNRVVGARGLRTIDESRHGIERMPPAEYLAASYYERWLSSLERTLVEKGIITRAELDARTALLEAHPETPRPVRQDPELVDRLTRNVNRRPSFERLGPKPRFQAGDQIVTRNIHPTGHTRLPRYVRGKRGVIHQYHGSHVFPDTNAHGLGEQPQPLYSVRFEGRELWGESAEPHQTLHIDLWERYLEPA